MECSNHRSYLVESQRTRKFDYSVSIASQNTQQSVYNRLQQLRNRYIMGSACGWKIKLGTLFRLYSILNGKQKVTENTVGDPATRGK